jgi:hypothetical protein
MVTSQTMICNPTVMSPKNRKVFFDWLLRKPDTQETVQERIHSRAESAKDGSIAKVNCIGTALYLSGEKRRDKFVRPQDADDFLKHLKRLSDPIEGCLVAWQTFYNDRKGRPRMYTFHMGVITQTHPVLLITDRVKLGGEVIQNQSFAEVNNYWSKGYKGLHKLEINYYLPRNLALRENLLRV